MSDITFAARSLLLGSTPVTDITDSIYIDHLPQGVKTPCVALWAISGSAEDYLGGFTGFEQIVLQVDCYSKTRQGARALWKAVNQAYSSFRGLVVGVEIRSISQNGSSLDREDRPEEGTDRYRYVTSQDFQFTYHVYERTC